MRTACYHITLARSGIEKRLFLGSLLKMPVSLKYWSTLEFVLVGRYKLDIHGYFALHQSLFIDRNPTRSIKYHRSRWCLLLKNNFKFYSSKCCCFETHYLIGIDSENTCEYANVCYEQFLSRTESIKLV